MFASVTAGGRVQPDQIDKFAAEFRSRLPRQHDAPGYKGMLVAVDRHTGKAITVGLWESEAAAQAGEALFRDALRELGQYMVERPTRDLYDVLIQD